MSTYTWVYLHLYEWFYYLYYGIHTIIRVDVDIWSFCVTYNYKIWIHTIVLVHIPMYTYNYMSNYTFINIMRYE